MIDQTLNGAEITTEIVILSSLHWNNSAYVYIGLGRLDFKPIQLFKNAHFRLYYNNLFNWEVGSR